MTNRKDDPPPQAEDAPSFEQALERLEAIVGQLEGGDLTLEESLARYEEGKRLSQRLTRILDEAEHRVERLGAEGEAGAPPAPGAPRSPAAAAREPGRAPSAGGGPARPGDGELPF